MLTIDIIHALINNIEKINEYTKKRGFGDIRVFKPLMKIQANSLHFLVKIVDTRVSHFDEAKLQLDLKKLLNYEDIIILTNDELTPAGQQEIIGETVLLILDHKEKIMKLFEHILNVNAQEACSYKEFKMG